MKKLGILHLLKPLFFWGVYFVMLCSDAQSRTSTTVIGEVTHGDSGTPMHGVKVTNRNNPKAEPQYTNRRGKFDIVAQAGDYLLFEESGYGLLEKVVDKERVVYASLKPTEPEAPMSLDTLLSTAGRSEKKVSQIPASVVVVTKKQIDDLGYSNIVDILRNVVGLYAIDEYDWTGAGANVGVRGFLTSGMNNSLQVMINGVSQLEDYWGFYPLARVTVPVEAIERTEVPTFICLAT